MKINRFIPNICTDNITESRDFYMDLFDFVAAYDSDWFVNLISKDKEVELGIIAQESEIVPEGISSQVGGYYLTFVVENVDEIFEKAKEKSFEVLAEPEDTFYGQRRLLLKDPNGVIVDISAPIQDFHFG